MTRRSQVATCAAILLVAASSVEQARAQTTQLTLGSPTVKTLRVEYNYVFSVREYAQTGERTYESFSDLPVDSPERMLLQYLLSMSEGETAKALSLWDKQSQLLINKRNSALSADELARATRNMFSGLTVRLVRRIEYGPYVLIETQLQGAGKPVGTAEAYALKTDNGQWRLTQELADDPVMCCWNTASGRIVRAGIPGENFKKVLEALR